MKQALIHHKDTCLFFHGNMYLKFLTSINNLNIFKSIPMIIFEKFTSNFKVALHKWKWNQNKKIIVSCDNMLNMNLHNKKWDIKIINVPLQGVQVVKAYYMHSYSSLMI
jgi:hypothetical protein